jgi:NitT/TauT family transport system ATP-binding protein
VAEAANAAFAAGPSHPAANVTASPLIELRNVDLSLGGHAILQGITLSVRKGEFVCVVGPSGCGKTTLLRLIAGLIKPTSGEVLYEDKEVVHPRRDVAIVFQDYSKALLPWRTVYENVSLPLEAMKLSKAQRREKILQLLDCVHLGAELEKYPAQLSGGMQQRLQIARCLAQDPVALLMDEPFGALDAMTRQTLQDEMQQIMGRSGATIFFVTHDLEEAIYLGDRVLGMRPHPGRIVKEFEVNIARPRNQLDTPERPEFLRLRRALFEFIKGGGA